MRRATGQHEGNTMRIADILKSKQTFSYEIFPPKGDMSVVQATDVAERLMQNSPD